MIINAPANWVFYQTNGKNPKGKVNPFLHPSVVAAYSYCKRRSKKNIEHEQHR